MIPLKRSTACLLLLGTGLTGCVGAGSGAPASVAPQRAAHSTTLAMPGLEAVIGKSERDLTRLFGAPRLDIREGDARKLQFGGGACLLDVYLYPEGQGGVQIATFVDARRSDGRDVDRAACVEALRKR